MLQFKDIMTREMIYYDEEYEEECKQFCKTRNISYLPAIHESRLGYNYSEENDRFEQFEITVGQPVMLHEGIFKNDVLEKFKNHEILFVMDSGELYGLVHFSDYNRPPVYEEIYKKLYKLERGLMHLVPEYGGKTIGELEEFLKTRVRSENPDTLLNRHDFSKRKTTLKDVMDFAFKTDFLRIRHIEKINKLRNKIAHSKDLVSKMSYTTGALKFNSQTFESLVSGKIALEIAIKQVANRLYFMKASMDENFSMGASNVYDEAFGLG